MATPTLIDWSQIRTRVEAYRALYGHDNDSMALTHVVLEANHGLTAEEAMDAITDGEDDRGIDAVYIDDAEEPAVIHLYQVKYVGDFEKTGNNFPSNEIDKVQSYLTDLQRKNMKLQKSVNRLLWDKTLAIWAAYQQGTPSLVVHFCGNMAGLTDNHRDRMLTFLAPYRIIEFREHTLASLVSNLVAQAAPKLDRKLPLVDLQYFERVDGNIRGLIATVEAAALVEMIRDPDNPDAVLRSIFDDNVRIYLTTRNEINKKIVASALSDENAEFWYLNNGITMTCDSMQYPPGTRAPILELTNVQIVNGGQTSNALFEAYRANPDRVRKVLLLVRVYETRAREISQLIAETTNSQTPVRSRDLRANDDIQKKLEDAFFHLGYFYERKANQHKDRPADKRIDALVAGQAYAAYHLDSPDTAKRDRRLIFGDHYAAIFNESMITADKLLTPFLLHVEINARKRRLQAAIRKGLPYDPKDLVLLDGVYHVLNACHLLLDLRGLDDNDLAAGKEMVDEAVKVVARVADEELRANPTVSYARLFKDKKTTTKIQAVIRDLGASTPALPV